MAALALYDGGAEITSDNIKALLDGSNNTVQPYWPALFATLLKGDRIESLIYSLSAGGAVVCPTNIDQVNEIDVTSVVEEKVTTVDVADVLDGGMDIFGSAEAKGDY